MAVPFFFDVRCFVIVRTDQIIACEAFFAARIDITECKLL